MIVKTPILFHPERRLFPVSRLPCVHYRYLVEGSCGIPFYCEELLKNLDQHRVLVFQPMESEEKANVTWNNLFSESHSDFFPCPSAESAARVGFSLGGFHQGQRVGGVQDCGAGYL